MHISTHLQVRAIGLKQFQIYLQKKCFGLLCYNFIVFGSTRSGLEHTIYRTRGEHANHYPINASHLKLMMKQ
jgi:hypothetical protein